MRDEETRQTIPICALGCRDGSTMCSEVFTEKGRTESATPFGHAMTTCVLKILNAVELIRRASNFRFCLAGISPYDVEH